MMSVERDELYAEVKEILKDTLDVEEKKITEGSDLAKDLGADSLDAVEVIMGIEEKFGITISDEDAQKIATVKDIVDYLEKRL